MSHDYDPNTDYGSLLEDLDIGFSRTDTGFKLSNEPKVKKEVHNRAVAASQIPKIHSQVWVCQDCMLIHANGECTHDESQPEPWALWDLSEAEIAMGGEHSVNCDRSDSYDCDCETIGFSTSQCAGCGSYLAGERYAFTVFEKDQP